MEEKKHTPLQHSPTWPYVERFSLEMERQLDLHRDRGDRPGWMTTSPATLMEALYEQAEKAAGLVMRLVIGVPLGKPDIRPELLRRCAHIANFAMMVADSARALGEPVPLATPNDTEEAQQKMRDELSEAVRAWWQTNMGGLPGPALESLLEVIQAAGDSLTVIGCLDTRERELVAVEVGRSTLFIGLDGQPSDSVSSPPPEEDYDSTPHRPDGDDPTRE